MTEEKDATTQRDILLIVLLWLVVTGYNLFKPYHIDDAAYLEIAKWILHHPGHPMQGILNWGGINEPISQTNQPHLYFYLMALWARFFGFSEPSMHALQSLFSLGCIALFYRLARVFARDAAIWTTAILTLGPAFIAEQNVMVDIPLLAMWLLFFNLILIGGSSQTSRYAGAALACSAAVLIKYSSLVLIPVLCISLLIERRKKQAWTMLIPGAALVAWSLFNYFDYGSVHIASLPPRIIQVTFRPIRFSITWLGMIGGLSPIGLILVAQAGKKSATRQAAIYAMIAILLCAVACAVLSGWLSDSRSFKLFWCVFMISGALTLVPVLKASVDLIRDKIWLPGASRETLTMFYLVVWIAFTTAFYVLQAPFIAARHVLQILPPLLLIASFYWKGQLTRISKISALALTVAVSTGICVSDWSFAAFYQSEAKILGSSLHTGGTLWTTGHWGWQWYSSLAGIRPMDVKKSHLERGDDLIVPESTSYETPETPPLMHLIRVDDEGSSVREFFCTGKKAGFYAYLNWSVPWYLTRECTNRIDVYRVDGEPPAQ